MDSSVIQIRRTSLHLSPLHQTKPGIKLEKFSQEEEEAKEVSYKAPLFFLKVLVPSISCGNVANSY